MIPSSPSQFGIHISLLFATLFSGICAQYIGCFREGLINQRLLPDERRAFGRDLTPDKCIDHCRRNGYSYAGVQDGWECFCSKKRPHFSRLATEEDECSTRCRGDRNKKCGGAWRISVYALKDEDRNYVLRYRQGCYRNWSKEKDVLSSVKKKFDKILTPELCVGYCFRRNFDFAAVHNGNMCHCGSNIKGKKIADKDCWKNCSGYDKLKCGSDVASTLYRTTNDVLLEGMSDQYEGCFVDSANRWYKEMKVFPDSLTPWVCIQHCHRKGYKVAALQYRTECYCGDKLYGARVRDGECDLDCAGDSRLTCGGRYRNSIYTYKRVNVGIYVGCYSDQRKFRTLAPLTLSTMPKNNSPQACIAHCQKLGSPYAGVQYGIECYCGHERPLNRLVTNDWRCFDRDCPGDNSQKCGGTCFMKSGLSTWSRAEKNFNIVYILSLNRYIYLKHITFNFQFPISCSFTAVA